MIKKQFLFSYLVLKKVIFNVEIITKSNYQLTCLLHSDIHFIMRITQHYNSNMFTNHLRIRPHQFGEILSFKKYTHS